LQVPGVFQQLGQVVQGIDTDKLAGVDQAHEQVPSDICAVVGEAINEFHKLPAGMDEAVGHNGLKIFGGIAA
jgi:hypothetical protein